MTDDQLAKRNTEMIDRLQDPAAFWKVINQMRSMGWRVRAMEGLRSPKRQDELFAQGLSQRKGRTGKHVTGKALDVVNDNAPNKEQPDFFADLAIVARKHGLQTGLLWGLPKTLRLPRQYALETFNRAKLAELVSIKRGWDPQHIEMI